MKHHSLRRTLLLLALFAVPAAAAANATGATAVYNQFCAHCHGLSMVNPGTASYDLRKFPRDDKARFFDSVQNGKGKMPPWGDLLTAEEMELLWEYVATRGGKEPMPADSLKSGLQQQSPVPATIAPGTLRVCLAENGGVWSQPRDNGGSGFEYLLGQQLAKRLSLTFEPVWYDSEQEEETTPARDHNALLAHRVCDLVAGVPLYASHLSDRSGQRAALPHWQGRSRNLARNFHVALKPIITTAPYARNEMAVVLHQSLASTRITSLADLDGLTVGIEQGTLSGALILNQGSRQLIQQAITKNPGPAFLRSMEQGAFQAALVSVSDFDRHRQRTPDSKLVLSAYRHRLGLNIAFALLASEQALASQASASIQALLASNAIETIAQQSHLTYSAPAKPLIQAVFSRRDLQQIQ